MSLSATLVPFVSTLRHFFPLSFTILPLYTSTFLSVTCQEAVVLNITWFPVSMGTPYNSHLLILWISSLNTKMGRQWFVINVCCFAHCHRNKVNPYLESCKIPVCYDSTHYSKKVSSFMVSLPSWCYSKLFSSHVEEASWVSWCFKGTTIFQVLFMKKENKVWMVELFYEMKSVQ